MKIEFEIISLKNQQITEAREGYVELFKSHLIYKIDFDSEVDKDPDDKMLGKKEDISFFEVLVRKEFIAGISLELTEAHNWLIGISVDGFAQDIKVYFHNKKYKEAKSLFDTIQNWLII